LAASRLKPGGIIAQWFHIYAADDQIVTLVLRTFGSVFPNMEIWDTGTDLVMLGSLQPWPTGPGVFRKGFAIDRVRTDLAMIGIQSPESLMARQLASQQTAFAIAGDGPIQSDLFPQLEYIAPQAFYMGVGSGILNIYDERTRQQLLAPPAKRKALGSLSVAQSQLIFDDSLNRQLGVQGSSTINAELWECVFGQPSSANTPCALPTPGATPPPPTDGTVVNLCTAAIAQGNWPQADQLASYALQQQPGNPDAAYLKRIIDRQLNRP
jgi:hypothetical protein